MPTRICRRCGEDRDLEADFFLSPSSTGGRNTICKKCIKKRRTRTYKVFTCVGCSSEYQRGGRWGSWSLCPQCVGKGRVCKGCDQFKPLDRFAVSGASSRFCNEGCFTAFNRDKTYGPGVAAQFAEECGICGAAESSGNRKGLAVDHCHESGAVRGLLCRQCNLAIGMFKDDPALLAAAIDYLRRAEQLTA